MGWSVCNFSWRLEPAILLCLIGRGWLATDLPWQILQMCDLKLNFSQPGNWGASTPAISALPFHSVLWKHFTQNMCCDVFIMFKLSCCIPRYHITSGVSCWTFCRLSPCYHSLVLFFLFFSNFVISLVWQWSVTQFSQIWQYKNMKVKTFKHPLILFVIY
jgi:hypothetical protein